MAEAAPNRRPLIVLTALVALYVAAQLLGLGELLDREQLRQLIVRSGPWGPLAFVGLFVGAVLAQIPGVLFIGAAPFLFSGPVAWALSLVASNIAVNANFAMVRRLGGAPIEGFERPWMQRLFEQLDSRPVRSVAVLRSVLIVLPPVTAALALTPITGRDHALGSALGVLLPVTLIVWGIDLFLKFT